MQHSYCIPLILALRTNWHVHFRFLSFALVWNYRIGSNHARMIWTIRVLVPLRGATLQIQWAKPTRHGQEARFVEDSRPFLRISRILRFSQERDALGIAHEVLCRRVVSADEAPFYRELLQLMAADYPGLPARTALQMLYYCQVCEAIILIFFFFLMINLIDATCLNPFEVPIFQCHAEIPPFARNSGVINIMSFHHKCTRKLANINKTEWRRISLNLKWVHLYFLDNRIAATSGLDGTIARPMSATASCLYGSAVSPGGTPGKGLPSYMTSLKEQLREELKSVTSERKRMLEHNTCRDHSTRRSENDLASLLATWKPLQVSIVLILYRGLYAYDQ